MNKEQIVNRLIKNLHSIIACQQIDTYLFIRREACKDPTGAFYSMQALSKDIERNGYRWQL